MRASGMLSEIRTQDLRFTTEETAAYLSRAQITPLSQNDLYLLDERFEGWPAGLHLPFHCVLQAAGNPSGWLYPARIQTLPDTWWKRC